MPRGGTDVDNLVCLDNRPHTVFNHYHGISCRCSCTRRRPASEVCKPVIGSPRITNMANHACDASAPTNFPCPGTVSINLSTCVGGSIARAVREQSVAMRLSVGFHSGRHHQQSKDCGNHAKSQYASCPDGYHPEQLPPEWLMSGRGGHFPRFVQADHQ